MTKSLLLASALFVAGVSSAYAEAPTTTTPLLSFGVGAFDMFDNVEQDAAVDLRAEYRFGDPFFYVFKPMIALQATTDGGGGAFGGVVADFVLADHWVVAPSLAAGFWGNGGGKDMGYPLEFRSQIEAGYRFDNDWRVTAAFSHMSNKNFDKTNPGSNMGTLYLHIPASTLLP